MNKFNELYEGTLTSLSEAQRPDYDNYVVKFEKKFEKDALKIFRKGFNNKLTNQLGKSEFAFVSQFTMFDFVNAVKDEVGPGFNVNKEVELFPEFVWDQYR
jgi:hypothetical protein